MGWSETDKIEAIGMHLSGKALRWYSSTILEIRDLDTVRWEEFKRLFMDAYNRKTDSPLDRWLDYTLEQAGDVETYFTEKTHLGNLASQNMANQISGLTRGMTDRFKFALATSQHITTTNEWFNTAKRLESINNARKQHDNKKPFNQQKRENSGNSNSKKPEDPRQASNSPRFPCQICAKQGKPNQMHWQNSCPNKPVGRVNVTEDTQDEDQAHQGNEDSSLDN